MIGKSYVDVIVTLCNGMKLEGILKSVVIDPESDSAQFSMKNMKLTINKDDKG